MSSPANAPTDVARRPARRSRSPCRSRPAGAARSRRASRSSREPVARARGRLRPRARRRRAQDAVRQCSVTLTPDFALDDHAGQPRFGLVGRGRDRVAVRHDTGIDACARRPRARSIPYSPARSSPATATCRARKSTGRPLTIPTRPRRADEPRAARSMAAGQRDRVAGAIDDRRERAVEVDEDRGSARVARRARRSLRRHRARRDATRMPPTAPDAKQAARDDRRFERASARRPESPHPRAPGAEVRGGALERMDRGRARRRRPRGRRRHLRPADRVLVPDRQRAAAPRDLRGVRRAARHRSRVRAQHHRGDRGRCGARARAARRRSRSHASV